MAREIKVQKKPRQTNARQTNAKLGSKSSPKYALKVSTKISTKKSTKNPFQQKFVLFLANYYVYFFSRSKIQSTTATPAHNTLNSHASHTLNSYSNTLFSHGGQSDYHKNSLEHDRSK